MFLMIFKNLRKGQWLEWVTLKRTKGDEAFQIYCNSCRAFRLSWVSLLDSFAFHVKGIADWYCNIHAAARLSTRVSWLFVEFYELFSKALLCSLAPTILIGWTPRNYCEIKYLEQQLWVLTLKLKFVIAHFKALKLSFTCSTLGKRFHWIEWEFSTWPVEQLFWSIYFSDDDSSNLVNSSNSKHRPEITVNLRKDNKKCLEGFQLLKFSCDSTSLPSKFDSKVQRCWFSANFSIASKFLWQSCTNLLAELHLSFSVQEPFGQSYIEWFKLRLQAIMIKSSKL